MAKRKQTKTAREISRIRKNIKGRIRNWGKYGFDFPQASELSKIENTRTGLAKIKKIEDAINRQINIIRSDIREMKRAAKKAGRKYSDSYIKRRVAGTGSYAIWGVTMRENLYDAINHFMNPRAREIATSFFDNIDSILSDEEFEKIMQRFTEDEGITIEWLQKYSEDYLVDEYLAPALSRMSSEIGYYAGMNDEEITDLVDMIYEENPAKERTIFYD